MGHEKSSVKAAFLLFIIFRKYLEMLSAWDVTSQPAQASSPSTMAARRNSSRPLRVSV